MLSREEEWSEESSSSTCYYHINESSISSLSLIVGLDPVLTLSPEKVILHPKASNKDRQVKFTCSFGQLLSVRKTIMYYKDYKTESNFLWIFEGNDSDSISHSMQANDAVMLEPDIASDLLYEHSVILSGIDADDEGEYFCIVNISSSRAAEHYSNRVTLEVLG